MLVAIVLAPLVVAAGLAAVAYYVDTIPAPADLTLPESTTIYYADGTTPMATLGSENRTILGYDDMNAAVKQAIVAAEDRTFWSNSGVSLSSVVRAGWNNVSGGSLQGGSTITQQYVRTAAGLKGVTFARKTREALLAWKMDRSYSKEKILEFYLNTVPFGRGAYGIEAAAQAYFGKTTRRDAPESQQVTVAEAMVLASVVKQPEPDPADPGGHPGYDPARGGTAAANSLLRWRYVRDGMVALGYLTADQAAALQYPHTVRPLDLSVPENGMDRPTGLVVDHVLSELRQSQPFAGQAPDYIRNGGFRIVTTVDKRAQDAAEAAADIRRPTAPNVDRGQPANWQAALVAVEPGTGRVLAYYGGNAGTGADFAGWYYDADGKAVGYGEHPPGSSFKVYDLAEALRQGISLDSHWDSPAVKEFPNSGRTKSSPTGPVRNSSSAPCQPDCTLLQATVASLNVPFFDLTERLGPTNVLDMAAKAGIDSMWTDPAGLQTQPARVDLRSDADKTTVAASAKTFSTEVGIGQYGVTVLDHANGMATFAAGGERAQAHFVRAVYRHNDLVYAEQLTQSPIGLTPAQVDQLTAALRQVPSAKLPNGWDAAGKTGTWQAGSSLTDNAHVWMVGYTRALAVAVWLGTTDGKALKTTDGKSDVFGSTHAAPIWSQFIAAATAAMNLDPKQRTFPVADTVATSSPNPTGR
jgi:membrane peptidoglycan carboxypeptidase